jgi:hypothetical protein
MAQEAMEAAAAALQQAADDIHDNRGSKAKLTLPSFDGKLDGTMTRNFLSKVDGYAQVTRLSPEETAQAVAFALVPGSAADHWMINLKERQPDDAATWANLRPLMLARFSPALTASEKAQVMDNCKQSKNQDVQTFKDQCITTQLILDRDMDNDLKIGGNAARYTADFDAAVLAFFLRGLREEGGLKSHVNASLNCTTLAHYLNAAIQYERHITRALKVAVVAELNQFMEADEADSDENMELEIAAIRAKQAARRGNGAARGRGGGRGGARPGAPGGPPRPPMLCWGCQSPSHINRDCPTPKRMPPRGGANGRGGGGPGRGARTAIDEMITRAGIQALTQQQATPQYEQQSSPSDNYSVISSLQYQQQPNVNFQ